MLPNPKKLILGLLLAAPGQSITVQEAINACGLFNITENNVRVSLVRLSSEGMIESCGRGAYQLGPNAQKTALEVSEWETAEQRLIDWNGSYSCVHSAALPRSDRKAIKNRERAFEILGFRELERGLHIRPNNIEGGISHARERLLALGVEAPIVTFSATEFNTEQAATIPTLWDGKSLSTLYKTECQRLVRWMENHHELELEVAARESYLIGGQAIRQVVFDPWLPEPMVDVSARHDFVAAVKRFDKVGKDIWQSLGSVHEAMPTAANTSPLRRDTLQ